MIEPFNPAWLSAKMPRVQKPRWLTDEYATSFFMSFCIKETSAPYTMPMIDSATSQKRTLGCITTLGKNGSEKRINPYVPIFNSTPARITDPAVGASTCASGSQVWNGNIGTLMANPRKNAKNSSNAGVNPTRDAISGAVW